jgi:hypothetical protein
MDADGVRGSYRDSDSGLFMGDVEPVIVAAGATGAFADFAAAAGCVDGLAALAFSAGAALNRNGFSH